MKFLKTSDDRLTRLITWRILNKSFNVLVFKSYQILFSNRSRDIAVIMACFAGSPPATILLLRSFLVRYGYETITLGVLSNVNLDILQILKEGYLIWNLIRV